VILAFVGVKMIISEWVHIETWISLVVIAVVLIAAIACSLWFPGQQDESTDDAVRSSSVGAPH
jgi:predicted tellurium resistance membrane protein TerC